MHAKDAASAIGLVFVGATGFLLAIAEKLDQRGRLTLEHSFWIACVLTVLSFICFGIEKILNSRDENARKVLDGTSATTLKEVLERVRHMDQKQFTPQQRLALEEAQSLYALLAESLQKPPAEAATFLQNGVQKVLEKAAGLDQEQQYHWRDITASLKNELKTEWSKTDSVRWAADSLLGHAFGIPPKTEEKKKSL